MQRYFVCRAYIKWKGHLYKKGDLLPETFTHHDKARSIYNSRIGLCEVDENTPAEVAKPTPEVVPEESKVEDSAKEVAPKVVPISGTQGAATPLSSNKPTQPSVKGVNSAAKSFITKPQSTGTPQ